MAQNDQKSVYFPSLDGLRFFAFLAVFLHHALYYVDSQNPVIKYFLIIFQKNGWLGLDLFFILSGFLITYLLLQERAVAKTISLKNFWIRRSLRIWPLYFLALLFGFFIAPFIGLNGDRAFDTDEIKQQFGFYIAFLGNWMVVTHDYSSFKNISHLWSISIEEQFYIFWPIILILLTTFRRLIIGSVFLILLALGIRFYLVTQGVEHPALYTNSLARMDTLVLGGLIATLFFYKPKLFSVFQKKFLPLLFFILLALFSYYLYRVSLFETYAIRNGVFGYNITSLFLGFFLIAGLTTPAIKYFLSNKILVWLGKISYGLYVWHILAIELVFKVLGPIGLQDWRFIPAFFLTILFGYISYYFYEKKFLQFKKKFSRVDSRPI